MKGGWILLFCVLAIAYSTPCSNYTSCKDCVSHDTKCVWCNADDTCQGDGAQYTDTCRFATHFEETCADPVFQTCQYHTECESCVKDFNCVWYKSGQFKVKDGHSSYVKDLPNGTCWVQAYLSGAPRKTTVHRWNKELKLEKGASFCFQCKFREMVYWMILVAGAVAVFLLILILGGLCGCCCCCCYCLARQNKRNSRPESVSINAEVFDGSRSRSRMGYSGLD